MAVATDPQAPSSTAADDQVKSAPVLGSVAVGVVSIGVAFTLLVTLIPGVKAWWKTTWIFEALFRPTTAFDKIFVTIFAILLFVLVMGAILWLVDKPRVPNLVVVIGFLGPVLVFLTVGLLWPAIRTVIDSFSKFERGQDVGWAGLGNYKTVFTAANTEMFINTVAWIFLVPLAATAFGLIYAVLVDRTRFEAAAKALIFLPTAISMVAAAVIWRYVYYQPAPPGKSEIGLLNGVVTLVGGKPKNWLILEFPAPTFALIVIMVWIQAGFAMTVLSASIKAIPDDIIEAAKIDGATGMRLFRSITIPSIRSTLVVVITTVAIASLKTFDIVNVLGNKLPRNDVMANAFYSALSNSEYGQAGAYAVLIFIVVTPVIIFNVRQMRKADSSR